MVDNKMHYQLIICLLLLPHIAYAVEISAEEKKQLYSVKDDANLSFSLYSDKNDVPNQVMGYKKVDESRASYSYYTQPIAENNHGNPILYGVGSNAAIPGKQPELKKVEDPLSFHAATFKKGKDVVVVFEGSGLNIKDWYDNNAKHPFTKEPPPQYKEALKYAEKIKQEYPNANIRVTGHSLGGGLAQYAAGTLGLKATTFNSAGLWSSTLEKAYQPSKNDKILNVVYGTDPVSKAGVLLGKTVYIGQDSKLKPLPNPLISEYDFIKTSAQNLMQMGKDHLEILDYINKNTQETEQVKNLPNKSVTSQQNALNNPITGAGSTNPPNQVKQLPNAGQVPILGGSTMTNTQPVLKQFNTNNSLPSNNSLNNGNGAVVSHSGSVTAIGITGTDAVNKAQNGAKSQFTLGTNTNTISNKDITAIGITGGSAVNDADGNESEAKLRIGNNGR